MALTKKQLQEQIAALNDKINNLGQQIKDAEVNAEVDADNTGATNNIVSLRAQLDAYDEMAKLFNDAYASLNQDVNGKASKQLKNLNNYQLGSDNNFAGEYWGRFCRGCKKGAASFEIKSKDIGLEEMIELSSMYAVGFNRAGITNKNGDISMVVITSFDRKTKKVLGIPMNTGLSSFSEMGNYAKPISSKGELELKDKRIDGKTPEEYTEGKDIAILEGNPEGVPDYVFLIPGLGKEVYFERQKQRNISFTTIIPSIGVPSAKQAGQIAGMLTDCDNTEIDAINDKQSGLNFGAVLDKIKGFLPPEEIKTVFQMLDINLARHREMFYSEFGGPVSNQDGEQQLNSDSSLFVANIEFASLAKYNRVARGCKTMQDIGLEIEVPNYDEMVNSGELLEQGLNDARGAKRNPTTTTAHEFNKTEGRKL